MLGRCPSGRPRWSRRSLPARRRSRRPSMPPMGSSPLVTCGPARTTRSTWREFSPSAPSSKRRAPDLEFLRGTAPPLEPSPLRVRLLPVIETIDEVQSKLADNRYIGDRALATSIFLALKIQKPLFIEGEAGVGKTEAAKVMADVLGARLIRLQCYEGIDLAHAAYEWNYPRQLLHIRLLGEGADRAQAEREIFSPDFLLRRPLLDAIDNDDAVPPVLLIDEIDRSDEEFEAFLLELLSDFQISIPELVEATLGAALKYQEDLERAREAIPALVQRAQGA